MKVLAVEDDPTALRILQLALQDLGHEVVTAAGGDPAWEELRRNPVRVVVSDWMMPGIDGLELCRRIRARREEPYVYFILVTALDGTGENKRAAADAGVDDFLRKPVVRDELWCRLRTAERILDATQRVQELEKLLPICSYCRKVRDDRDYWQELDRYVSARTQTQFSHSICPDCYQAIAIPQLEAMKAQKPEARGAPQKPSSNR